MQWNLIISRKELKLSQVDMAKELKMSKDTYGRKERGETQFTADEMFLISDFLGKPIDQIFLRRKCINNAVK
ncbi:helix-turn-helix transcriptional regulator [Oceanobacillus jeddahense]|uniref:helix-turn-helix transcriptional regulator n=1 Tax=Oceanobacillus jeddahense TaxID=1462527 RepID=UPI00363D90C8